MYRHIFLCLTVFVFCASPLFGQEPDGRQVYSDYCAQCHGANLQGGNAQSLVNGIWQFGASRGYRFRNIKYGIPDMGMPAYEQILTDSQINAVVAYLEEAEKEAGATRPLIPETMQMQGYDVKVEMFAQGLEIPWAIDFLDANTALITERPGRLRVVKNGALQAEPVQGTPAVLHEGQGGLMDVAIDPEYAQNGWLYLSYSHALDDGSARPPAMTRIVRGRMKDNAWIDQQVVYEAPHHTYRTSRHHYGSRIVFDPQGYLYFSIGDRGAGSQAQDLSRPNGKVHRIHRDGRIPQDNPFVNRTDALPTIFTYGNRNIQGLAVHPETGEVWSTEHGPMGGDELNLLRAGVNYGWPEISYGRNYNGTVLTEFTHKPGMEQPNLYWQPSIAVCGLDFYRGDLFAKWRNKLLVGALRFEEVRLLTLEKDRMMHQEVVFKNQGRVRDVSVGPEGAVYVVLNNPGTVLRLTPIAERITQ